MTIGIFDRRPKCQQDAKRKGGDNPGDGDNQCHQQSAPLRCFDLFQSEIHFQQQHEAEKHGGANEPVAQNRLRSRVGRALQLGNADRTANDR